MSLRSCLLGISTRVGSPFGVLGQTRSYIRNFWAEKTAYPFPGHMYQDQKFFQHVQRLRIRIRDKRPTEIKRLRYYGYESKMKFATGRQGIMKKILKGELFFGET